MLLDSFELQAAVTGLYLFCCGVMADGGHRPSHGHALSCVSGHTRYGDAICASFRFSFRFSFRIALHIANRGLGMLYKHCCVAV